MRLIKYGVGSIVLSLFSLAVWAQGTSVSPKHGGMIASSVDEGPYVVEMVQESNSFTFYIYDEDGNTLQPTSLGASGEAEFDFEDPVLAKETATVSIDQNYLEVKLNENYPIINCYLTLSLDGEVYHYNFAL